MKLQKNDMDNSDNSNPSWSVGARSVQILPLTLSKVSYEIDGIRLIKDLSVEFLSDSLSVVLGPNGAGKSLMLRLCHGLIQPSSGTIEWGGKEKASAKCYQAMVFQRPIMLRRDVFSNLSHGLKHRGIKKSERVNRIEEILKHTGLTRLADVPARRLSVGEQQRLAIARAWCLDPEVLFLDEPTASLDPAATYSLERIINSIKRSGTKIIMTTHDLGQAQRLADEVLFLYRGRLLERTGAKQFFDQPENDLAQSFLRGELLWWNRKELKPPAGFNYRDEK
jgi:tungstate transport system ATP-binding protein